MSVLCVHLRLVVADMGALAFDREQLPESGDRSAYWSIGAILRRQLPTVAAERSRPVATFICETPAGDNMITTRAAHCSRPSLPTVYAASRM